MTDKPKLSFAEIRKSIVSLGDTKNINLCYSDVPVTIKQLKMKDKKDLLKAVESEDKQVINKAIDVIIEKYSSLANDEPVSAKSLVEEERQQILVEIKKISSFDSIFKTDLTCDNCKKETENVEVKYEDIKCTSFGSDKATEIETSNGKASIKIGHLTREDHINIGKYIKDKKMEVKTDINYIYLASSKKSVIVSIDDMSNTVELPTIDEKIQLLDGLVVSDVEKISNYFNSCPEFGPSIKMKFKCKHCGHENDQEASILNFFMA